MAEIRISAYIHAPREDVFAYVSDHERFLQGGAIKSCRVTKPGAGDRNGLGALREVLGRGIRFVEEVTHFEPPARYDYLIRECNLPIDHEGGSLRLIERGDGTEIEWVTRFTIPVPLLGKALAQISVLQLTDQFNKLLLRTKRDLEATHRSRPSASAGGGVSAET